MLPLVLFCCVLFLCLDLELLTALHYSLSERFLSFCLGSFHIGFSDLTFALLGIQLFCLASVGLVGSVHILRLLVSDLE